MIKCCLHLIKYDISAYLFIVNLFNLIKTEQDKLICVNMLQKILNITDRKILYSIVYFVDNNIKISSKLYYCTDDSKKVMPIEEIEKEINSIIKQ